MKEHLMNELISVSQKQWPEKIMVPWRRLASGLWRVAEGDVSAAYSAESFPKVKVFTHEDALFTNCGGFYSGPVASGFNCYPLIPAGDYRGPEPRQYTWEGRDVCYKAKTFKLGSKVIFDSTDATMEEWRGLFRAMYADGGYFARQASYGFFLEEYYPAVKSENARAALKLETSEAWIGWTKAEMKQFLDGEASSDAETKSQPELAFTLS